MVIQKKIWAFWIAAFAIIPIIMLVSLSTGSLAMSVKEVIYPLFSHGSSQHIILFDIRLPRYIVAFLAGGAFSVSGCLLQALTRNALACPSLLGINQGASFAIILFLLWVPFAATHQIVLVAFLGGIFAALLTYFFAQGKDFSPLQIALVGITVNGLFFCLANGLLLLFPERAQMLIFNINGSVAGVSWSHVYMILPWLSIGLLIAFFYGPLLNLLSLGEQKAKSLGINIKKHQIVILVTAVLLACCAVSSAGPIAFLGLLVPHGLRYFIGEDYRHLILLNFVYGGIFLTFADTVLRLLNPVSETPVGILVAILGAPLLINIACRKKAIA